MTAHYQAASSGQGKQHLRETQSMLNNWSKALEETIRHVCGTADFAKDMTLNARLQTMTLKELEKHYSSVISSHRTYLGTGYFNPLGSAENKAIIARYNQLKQLEEQRVTAQIAELNKYHYLNIYKTIQETGYHPSGRKATDLEKKIAPYVPLIEPIQVAALIYAGRQYTKNSPFIDNYGRPNQSANSVEVRRSPKSVSVKAPVKSRVTKFLTDVEIADNFVKELTETTKTNYGVREFQSSGGFEQTLRDFESLPLVNIKDTQTTFGLGKSGQLPDGTTVVARPGSSSGRGPTLEFQFRNSKVGGGRSFEVRYPIE